MNINTPEESLEAWSNDVRNVTDSLYIPEDDMERMLHETNENHALMYDVVTAYVQSRFCTVF